MAESILERIAAWHATEVAKVTTANGYQQTLTVARPKELLAGTDTVTDLTTICELGECAEDDDPTMQHYHWRQTLHAWVHILGQGGTAVAVDTRITRIIADIQKQIGASMTPTAGLYCNSLAYRIDILPWSIGVKADDSFFGIVVDVPIAVAFKVSRTNPYSQ